MRFTTGNGVFFENMVVCLLLSIWLDLTRLQPPAVQAARNPVLIIGLLWILLKSGRDFWKWNKERKR